MNQDSYVPANGTNAEEDAAQSRIVLDKQWRIAKRTIEGDDSRDILESLEIVVTGEDDLFYLVTAPEGWYRDCHGYTTNIKNPEGSTVLYQFCKLAPWDTRANVSMA